MVKYIKVLFTIMLAMTVMVTAVNADQAVNKAKWSTDSLDLAVGDEAVVTLTAEIPAGKTLSAYSFALIYNDKVVELTASAVEESVMKPKNINNKGVKSGKNVKEVIANSFSIKGIKNKTDDVMTIELVDVNVTALEAGFAEIGIRFDAFGSGPADNFFPEAASLKVNVR